jgi:hypothetical protein
VKASPADVRTRMTRLLNHISPGSIDVDWWREYLAEAANHWLRLQRSNTTPPTTETVVHVQVLRIPPDCQGASFRLAILGGLCEAADALGWTLTVVPERIVDSTSVEKMRRLLQAFGFVQNRGRKRDDLLPAGVMYRKPRKV